MYFTTPGPLNYSETQVRRQVAKVQGLALDGDRGTSAIEWVIISALLIGIVAVVGGIILTKLTTAANDLKVG